MLSQIIGNINSAVIISIFIGLIFIKIPEHYFLSHNIRFIEFLIKAKDFKNAEDIILECLKKNPNKAKLYNLYGRLLIEKNNLKLAEKILFEGLNKKSNYSQLHYNLSIIYLLTGEIEKSEEYNNNALKINKKNPKILQQKLVILFKKESYIDIIRFYDIHFKEFQKNEIIQEEVITYTLFSAACTNDLERYSKLLKELNIEHLKNIYNSYHILVSSYLMEDNKTIKKMLEIINKYNLNEYLTKEQKSNIEEIKKKINSNSLIKTIHI